MDGVYMLPLGVGPSVRFHLSKQECGVSPATRQVLIAQLALKFTVRNDE
jgi:hypothetical protein